MKRSNFLIERNDVSRIIQSLASRTSCIVNGDVHIPESFLGKNGWKVKRDRTGKDILDQICANDEGNITMPKTEYRLCRFENGDVYVWIGEMHNRIELPFDGSFRLNEFQIALLQLALFLQQRGWCIEIKSSGENMLRYANKLNLRNSHIDFFPNKTLNTKGRSTERKVHCLFA